MSGIETLFMKGNGTLSWTAGPAKITGDNAGGLEIISAANQGISISAGSSIFFDTGGIDRMMISADGNVGIGTNEPTRLLDARGPVSLGDPFNTPSAANQNYLDTMQQFRGNYGIALQWGPTVALDTWWGIYPGANDTTGTLNFSHAKDGATLAGQAYILTTRGGGPYHFHGST